MVGTEAYPQTEICRTMSPARRSLDAVATSGKLKRRHHTVPRFYLERFADERGRLGRVELPGDRRHPVMVGDASVEKDFYLIEYESGTKSDALEDILGEIEGGAAEALRAIVDDGVWPIPGPHRWAIAAWAASQALRTPTQRQALDEIADILLKLQVGAGGRPQIRKLLRDRLGHKPTDEEVEERWQALSDFDSYRVRPHQNSYLQNLVRMLPGTTAMFHDRAWTLIRFQRKTLLTCDNPVHLEHARGSQPGSGVGLLTAAAVTIPLDRRVALTMGDIGGPDRQLPGTTYVARVLNLNTAWNSHRAIFHHPCDGSLVAEPLPEPNRNVMGGHEDIKSMIFPEGMGAMMAAAKKRATNDIPEVQSGPQGPELRSRLK